jgi:hypothetical protein
VGTRRLDMRFADSEHIELNASTTSVGFRLDFHRLYEEQYAPPESIIIGNELGRFLNKENEGVITVVDGKVGVSKNWAHSNAIVSLEHEHNTVGRPFKWHDKVRLLHVGSGKYFKGKSCCGSFMLFVVIDFHSCINVALIFFFFKIFNLF